MGTMRTRVIPPLASPESSRRTKRDSASPVRRKVRAPSSASSPSGVQRCAVVRDQRPAPRRRCRRRPLDHDPAPFARGAEVELEPRPCVVGPRSPARAGGPAQERLRRVALRSARRAHRAHPRRTGAERCAPRCAGPRSRAFPKRRRRRRLRARRRRAPSDRRRWRGPRRSAGSRAGTRVCRRRGRARNRAAATTRRSLRRRRRASAGARTASPRRARGASPRSARAGRSRNSRRAIAQAPWPESVEVEAEGRRDRRRLAQAGPWSRRPRWRSSPLHRRSTGACRLAVTRPRACRCRRGPA